MAEYGTVLFGLFFCIGTCLSETLNIPTTADSVNGMSEYIYFSHQQTWNTAKRVCAGIGGQLATVDTFAMLDEIQAQAEGPWSSSWDHMWIGLHRAGDQSLIHQDCSPFDFDSVGITFFKDSHDYDYSATKQCLRVQKDTYRMEYKECYSTGVFLCERKSGTCQYNTVNTTAVLVSQSGATSGSCRTVCDGVSGCYLAGNYFDSHCVLLKAPAATNPMSAKMCSGPMSTNSTNTDSYKSGDEWESVPTTCSGATTGDSSGGDASVDVLPLAVDCPSSNINVYTSTEVICSTEVVTLTPSANDVTVVVTSAFTDTVTEWLTETQVVSLTEISTAVLTSAETLTTTETTVQVISTCAVSFTPDSSCVTEITSTNVFTTMADCPSVTPEYLTLTSSCPEQSVEVSPTTITLFESTSCPCEMTLSPSGAISPDSASSFLTSASLMSTSTLPGSAVTTICRAFNATNIGEEALDALVASIVKELTVETKNLSSTIRKKTSASDPRVSSVSIGYGSLALILVPFVVIILLDFPVIFRDIRKYLLNIKSRGYP